jgi:radical SAM protein with 4Fe4S-binding SPASM domain
MKKGYVSSLPLPEFRLWKKAVEGRPLFSFDFDLTARCNNNCRHCYINLPAGDAAAKGRELSLAEIARIASEAASLGAFWCLLSGGEPLLREDFADVYTLLKKKGLLVSVFSNAALIGPEHVRLFKAYPPRDVEVSVYGATQETYEKVTRTPGSFEAFLKGLDLLLGSGVKVRLKAMALRSNVHEFPAIAAFCRARTKDYFRFDPFIHLRYDGDEGRNAEIRAERLAPEDIVRLERADPDRFRELREKCGIRPGVGLGGNAPVPLFTCGAGLDSFSLGYDGQFRLCSSLAHPDCVYDLRKGRLREAWRTLVPRVRGLASGRLEFLKTCPSCPVIGLCQWCPALAYLESRKMDVPVEFFCGTARARAEALGSGQGLDKRE